MLHVMPYTCTSTRCLLLALKIAYHSPLSLVTLRCPAVLRLFCPHLQGGVDLLIVGLLQGLLSYPFFDPVSPSAICRCWLRQKSKVFVSRPLLCFAVAAHQQLLEADATKCTVCQSPGL